MTFEIIKNSESYTGYNIEDDIFKGYFDGFVCGWQFEYVNDEGIYTYGSVSYTEETPEEYAYRWVEDDGTPWIASVPMSKGWRLTGRVIFRGYGRLYWDDNDRDWCVEDVDMQEVM